MAKKWHAARVCVPPGMAVGVMRSKHILLGACEVSGSKTGALVVAAGGLRLFTRKRVPRPKRGRAP